MKKWQRNLIQEFTDNVLEERDLDVVLTLTGGEEIRGQLKEVRPDGTIALLAYQKIYITHVSRILMFAYN